MVNTFRMCILLNTCVSFAGEEPKHELGVGSWELGLITRSRAESRDTSKRSENRSALLRQRWQCMSWELVSLRSKKAK